MVNALGMWLAYMGASVRMQMQYRASFATGLAGQFLATGIEFVGLWALFNRFGTLRGWTLAEVGLFYGAANIAFAIADMLATGYDNVGYLVRRGELDRLLLRPRTTVLQLLGYEVALRRLGRFTQGAAVLAWAGWSLHLDWSLLTAGVLLASVASATCLFLGLFVLQGTMAIWTVQSLELVNATTYGGVYAAQNPLSIYARWFRWFFTFCVPLACVLYWPLLIVLGKDDPLGTPAWLGLATLPVGPVFLAGALRVWAWGVKRYTSTGS